MKYSLSLGLASTGIALDRVLKWYALQSGTPIIKNEAFLFFLTLRPNIILIFNIAIFLALGITLIRSWGNNRTLSNSLIFILAGAFGNTIDRAWYGGVIDILHFKNLVSFNLADVLIVVGIVYYSYTMLSIPSSHEPL